MATEKSPSQVIQIAKICQVLSINDASFQKMFKGGYLDERYPYMLYAERKALEYVNRVGASDVQSIANYVWGLCWYYAARAENILNNLTAVITITDPINQNVAVGASASFTVNVTVSNGSPYTLQWYRDGILIPGATSNTYTLTNAQLVDSGAQFSATATSSVGTVSSLPATLTVTAALVGFYYFGDTDFFNQLNSGIDNVPYVGQFNIVHNASLVVDFTSGAVNNKCQVVKYPVSESVKTTWVNVEGFNFGTLPDQAYNIVLTFGGWHYIVSRGAISLFSTNSVVTFS